MAVRDLLLDTHIMLWMALDPDRIPRRLQAAIQGASHRFVSAMTAFEIQTKRAKHPHDFTFSLADLDAAMREFSCQELPITYQDIRSLEPMRFLHSDPFDRVIMAQAANRNICLVTVDRDVIRTAERYKEFRVLAT